MAPTYDTFVVTAPGLERLAADELGSIGAAETEVIPGGVRLAASPHQLYAANLHLRTATRVVVRIGAFEAKGFRELESRAAKLPWESFVSPRVFLSLSVSCRKSRLYHTGAIAERVASAIASRVGGARFSTSQAPDDEGSPDREEADPEQLVLVRFLRDRCTISIDSSGARLHLRGYRQAVAKAPIRETLAAAAVLASGWRGDAPLIDPMCGSGTIPIEAALIARRMAPGLRRRFAFEAWPDLDEAGWRAAVAAARTAVRETSPVRIIGSDRDDGAIGAAISNAERAGVAADIEFSRRALSALDAMEPPGWLVSNPPYGVRVGDRDRLRNLYAQLGKVALAKLAGWRVTLISADRDLERQTRIAFSALLETSNGGIPVRVVTGLSAGESAPQPEGTT